MMDNERFIEAINSFKKTVELKPTFFGALNNRLDTYGTDLDNEDLALFYYK